MISRVWTAVAGSEADAAAYEAHFAGAVLPELRTIDGHRGAYLMRRHAADGIHLLVVTLWESRAAIRAFAGEDTERAVVEPEARRVLARFDDRVLQYDVAVDAAG